MDMEPEEMMEEEALEEVDFQLSEEEIVQEVAAVLQSESTKLLVLKRKPTNFLAKKT